jgi:hypothetical protein
MDANQFAVFGSLHVELESEPKFEAGSEICQCVFGGVAEQAPVSND